jgi:quinol monooxygenase YgiN
MSWPIRSGPVPPLAEFFIPRQETGFACPGTGHAAGKPAALLGAEEPGVYLLAGPGGVGKTQLAVAFAHRLWRSCDIDLLVWVPASSRTAVLTGYAQALADASTLPGGPPAPGGLSAGDDLEAIAARFLTWLTGTSRPWLVVLDDVADAAHLAGLWPPGRSGRTVLTTRLLSASVSPPRQSAKVMQVGPFSRREVLGFLTMRLDSVQRIQALDLAKDLGCLPIAVAQAAAVIADSDIDCRDYRARFADRSRTLGVSAGDRHIAGGPAGGECAAVTAVTCSLALDRTDRLQPAALSRPVLAMAALLGPAGVPGTVLTSDAACDYIGSYGARRASAAKSDVWAVLSDLARMGLVTIDPVSTVRSVYMHAVVQACIQQVLPEAVRAQAAGAAAEALLQAWPGRDPGLLLDQALRDCAVGLSQAAGDVLWAASAHPLLVRVGESLTAARLAGPAIKYWRAMIETGRQVLGPAHAQSHEFVQRLAQAAQASGRADLVLETHGQALAGRRSALRRAAGRVPPPEGAMFGLCVRVTCKDQDSAEAYDWLVAEAAEAIKADEPGTLVYAAHRVAGQPLLRIFYELYRDKEAFAAHWAAPRTRRYLAKRDAYLASTEAAGLAWHGAEGPWGEPGFVPPAELELDGPGLRGSGWAALRRH